MIHGIYGQTIASYLSLLESNINTSVSNSNLRWLFKFTNDLTKDVKYVYGNIVSQNDRFINQKILHNTTEDTFTGALNFKPYGYWSYEVYEVSWIGSVALNTDQAPESETEILSVHNNNGVVEGKVHEGKLYISETAGSEQIKYTTHTEASGTNYLYTD
tara:strand:- start:416 stop:892 length:477 start_codon:yes stop_codon:yes gene_type:complete